MTKDEKMCRECNEDSTVESGCCSMPVGHRGRHGYVSSACAIVRFGISR